jgi:Rrf2 family protein
MELNNTSQYAIRILSYIANSKDDLSNAKELSQILNIPYKFLTKITAELVKADFILSIRGREGGYKLSRPASEITIMNILNHFNEFNHQQECLLGIGMCDGTNKCGLHDQWVKPKKMIKTMFENTTLANIKEGNYKI